MAANKKQNDTPAQSSTCTHAQEAVQRPDVGVRPEFDARRLAKEYRYDSSLAPKQRWDENADREMAEWLLGLIAEAAERGEQTVFAQPQVWQGTNESFRTLAECIARLNSLTQPFPDWSGKAERRRISLPTIPLFVHKRHATQAILDTLESYKASGTISEPFVLDRNRRIAVKVIDERGNELMVVREAEV